VLLFYGPTTTIAAAAAEGVAKLASFIVLVAVKSNHCHLSS